MIAPPVPKPRVLRGDPYLTIKVFDSELSRWVVEAWFAPAGGSPQAGLEMVQALEAAEQIIADCAKLGEPIQHIDTNMAALFFLERGARGHYAVTEGGKTLFGLPLRCQPPIFRT